MKSETWQIAAIFSFSLLGATYVSGFEWLRFFSYYGTWGTIGLLAAIFVLIWTGLQLSSMIRQQQIRDLNELFIWLCGPILAPTVTLLTYLVIFMYTGTALAQQISNLAGVGFLPSLISVTVACVIICWLAGLSWPRLLALSTWAALAGVLGSIFLYLNYQALTMPSLTYQLNLKWIWQAILYLSLHLILMLVIMFPLTNSAADDRSLRTGILKGGGIFAVISLLGHFAILSHWHDVHDYSAPLQQIFAQLFPGSGVAYALVGVALTLLFAAIWIYSLALPMAERLDIYLPSVILLFALVVAAIALLSLVVPGYIWLSYTAITYLGLFCLLLLISKRT